MFVYCLSVLLPDESSFQLFRSHQIFLAESFLEKLPFVLQAPARREGQLSRFKNYVASDERLKCNVFHTAVIMEERNVPGRVSSFKDNHNI